LFLVVLSGCFGPVVSDQPETSPENDRIDERKDTVSTTATEERFTPTQKEENGSTGRSDENASQLYDRVQSNLTGATAHRFELTVLEDDIISPAERQFLRVLLSFGKRNQSRIATSVLEKTITSRMVSQLESLRSAPPEYRTAFLRHGALEDEDEDGLFAGTEAYLGTSDDRPSPEIRPVFRSLDSDSLTRTELEYLRIAGLYLGVCPHQEHPRTEAYCPQNGIDGSLQSAETTGTVTQSDVDELENASWGTTINDREWELLLNRSRLDHDGDGFEDSTEILLLENASPTRPDVFVEIDSTAGRRIPPEVLTRVERRFWNRSPSGPIELHFIRDQSEIQHYNNDTSYQDLKRNRLEHFDNRGMGYHHVFVTGQPIRTTNNTLSGISFRGHIIMQILHSYRVAWIESLLLHELGHALGIDSYDHTGVDGRKIPTDEYPSEMNYNAPDSRIVGYSDGTNGEADFNDWREMRRDEYHITCTSRLRSLAGKSPDESLNWVCV